MERPMKPQAPDARERLSICQSLMQLYVSFSSFYERAPADLERALTYLDKAVTVSLDCPATVSSHPWTTTARARIRLKAAQLLAGLDAHREAANQARAAMQESDYVLDRLRAYPAADMGLLEQAGDAAARSRFLLARELEALSPAATTASLESSKTMSLYESAVSIAKLVLPLDHPTTLQLTDTLKSKRRACVKDHRKCHPSPPRPSSIEPHTTASAVHLLAADPPLSELATTDAFLRRACISHPNFHKPPRRKPPSPSRPSQTTSKGDLDSRPPFMPTSRTVRLPDVFAKTGEGSGDDRRRRGDRRVSVAEMMASTWEGGSRPGKGRRKRAFNTNTLLEDDWALEHIWLPRMRRQYASHRTAMLFKDTEELQQDKELFVPHAYEYHRRKKMAIPCHSSPLGNISIFESDTIVDWSKELPSGLEQVLKEHRVQVADDTKKRKGAKPAANSSHEYTIYTHLTDEVRLLEQELQIMGAHEIQNINMSSFDRVKGQHTAP
uniref:Uncharacterized protein n=1 Tax=Vitrella brassicaformis TaxID=1169539 RepID=A0A7S1NXE7_9ALVE|mmetsp:Transcript_12786/g.30494  ORF Transcript_12786/g.30494 Transcript_12786/m.30494 type:complete len:497 (+) Transcript_12786:108-1598(+)